MLGIQELAIGDTHYGAVWNFIGLKLWYWRIKYQFRIVATAHCNARSWDHEVECNRTGRLRRARKVGWCVLKEVNSQWKY